MACLATWKYLCSKQPCLLECWPFLLLVISGHSTICRVCACACIRVCCTTPLQTWIRIHIYMHIQVLIRAHISTHRNTNINTHKHAYYQYTYTRTNVHMCTYSWQQFRTRKKINQKASTYFGHIKQFIVWGSKLYQSKIGNKFGIWLFFKVKYSFQSKSWKRFP